MTRPLLVAGAAALALALAACDGQERQGGEGVVAGAPDANPTATVATPADESSAPDYVDMAATSALLEIETAKVAQRRAVDDAVKAFAGRMIEAHTAMGEDLKAALAVSDLEITVPTTLPADMQADLDELNSAEADVFDDVYMEKQVDAHQNALDLHGRYARDGDNARLKQFAAKAAPVVQQHYDSAVALREKLRR